MATLYVASIRHDGTDVWITSAHLTQQEAKAEIVRAAVAVGFSPESAHFDEFSDAADFLAAHDFDTRVRPAELSDTRGDRSDQTRHEARSGERGREGEVLAMTRNFYQQHNIGRARYVINFHNGRSTHPDGSPFYDVAIFRSKLAAAKFMRQLRDDGYQERGYYLPTEVTR